MATSTGDTVQWVMVGVILLIVAGVLIWRIVRRSRGGGSCGCGCGCGR